MKYGGEYRPEWIRGRHLDRLGEDLGIAPRRVRKHAKEIAGLALERSEPAREALPPRWQDSPIIDSIDLVVAEFAEVLRRAADESA